MTPTLTKPKSKTNAQRIGQAAENAACTYLQSQGLTLIQRNYRCLFGEIDLIMQDKTSLIFIEVRFRRQQLFGASSETVTASKQQKLLKTANFYLQQQCLTDKMPCRFDIIAMTQASHLTKLNSVNIEWIKNAICAN